MVDGLWPDIYDFVGEPPGVFDMLAAVPTRPTPQDGLIDDSFIDTAAVPYVL